MRITSISDTTASEKFNDGTVGLKYIETSGKIADGLTKPISKVLFLDLRKVLGSQYMKWFETARMVMKVGDWALVY